MNYQSACPSIAFCIPVACASQGQNMQSQTSVAGSCADPSKRRHLQLAAIALLSAGADVAGVLRARPCSAAPFSGRQLVNGMLSGYGMPTMKDVEGFSKLLEQYDKLVVQFQYPTDWIIARNVLASSGDVAGIAPSSAKLSFGTVSSPMEGRAAGLTVGDYRRAEGLAFFVSSDIPRESKIADVPAATILNLVVPGDATGQAAEYTLTKDNFDAESGYRTLWSKYESTTISGYTVERRGIAAATVLSDGKLYCLSGTCSENRFKKIGDKLRVATESFRVYRI